MYIGMCKILVYEILSEMKHVIKIVIYVYVYKNT